jgi:hypothetical protein
MELYRIIRELLQERERVQRIIESLEQVMPAGKTRVPQNKKRRGRKSMDRAARAEVSERMKRYWARRRAEQKEGHSHAKDGHSAKDGHKEAHSHARDAHSKDHGGDGKG